MESILVVGLGNPGPKYNKNRHNIGFRILDHLANDKNISIQSKKKFEVGEGLEEGWKIFLLKPLEFMNLSGNAVGEISRMYKIPIENTIILHDELDIPFGSIKTKLGGGTAGHNGLKSISEMLGSNSYARIRFGVGKPPVPGPDISDWVLQNFSEDEEAALPNLIQQSLDKLKVWFYETRKRSH